LWDSKNSSSPFKPSSPLLEEEEKFEELGQWLKRNSVAVDIINFAHPENVGKLQALVNAANSSENSHFVDIPLGVAMITDVLIASPIINPDEGGNAGGNPAGASGVGGGAQVSQFSEYGGVDPSLDPELAMALRISLEEERSRQHTGPEGGEGQQQ
jgi:26S proteasome regulatory subunit N10